MVKRNKYLNKKIEYDGIKFDSVREKERYIFLKEKEKQGIIENLVSHPDFLLLPEIREKEEIKLKTKTKTVYKLIQREIRYVADFKYLYNNDIVIEDVKISPKLLPKEFSLKRKMFFYRYRINIKLIYNPRIELDEM